ncbi:far upstream element-binding protein 2-like isoform X3 [Anguilla anguilla]|uniref:far upstream element-binding protein 2-like isoform X3 n=1 Tax=Anguilla anguilla TaxID=7936 RepID=UPI0015AFE22B|nr:far upstream element-binding protein 2-like isoform X3 [Anguilla anguilla]
MSEYSAVPQPGAGAPLGGQSALGVGGGIKKDAFADAVQRARQIAAKIGGDAGGGAPSMNNSSPVESFPFTAQKRQLEDAEQPDSKKMAPQSDRDTATALSIRAQLAALAQQSRPTTTTEDYSVPDGMVGLNSGGLPERSVSLTGSPDSIQKAKMLLDEIVSRGRGTPPSSFHESTNGQSGSVQEMMIPAGKAGLIIGKGGETIKQLQERAGVKMILIQDGSQCPNVDKPLRIIGEPYKVQHARELVQEILCEKDHPGFGERSEYGSRMGGGGIDVPVPRHSVGVVIGRNGEMIKKIQNDAGVRIQFKPDDGVGPDKVAHIMGPPERCDHAASIITDLLQSIRAREEGQGGPPGPPGPGMPPGRGRGRGQGNWGPPGGEVTFSIPSHKCGLVIGRGGENVKAINQQTGAFVEISRQLPPNGDPNFKLFIIRGSPQQIDHAKQLIEDKIEGPLCPVGPGPGGPGPSGPMGPYNPNPYNQGPPGGPGPHGPPPPHQYPPQGWGNAYQQWQPPGPHDPSKAAAADPNAAWAAYYAQYYQQPPGAVPGQPPAAPSGAPAPAEQPQAGQTPGGPPDYTKAWEEYYKKMAQAGGGAQAAAAAAGPASGGAQPDYSAAWAEYYRQQAAYYGQPGAQPAGQPAAPQQGQQVLRSEWSPSDFVLEE